jgi:hypothetical protein
MTTSPRPLRLYWFKFRPPHPKPLQFGCGVSAYSYEDAFAIVRDRLFGGHDPEVLVCEPDVDVPHLDPKHVLPNIGSVMLRGIWFPLGYR